MVLVQRFDRRTGRFVKMNVTRSGSRITDVKQREPLKPFKGVPRFKNLRELRKKQTMRARKQISKVRRRSRLV